jgi:hypothetical protein
MKVLCLILLLGCAAAGPVAAATVGIAAAPVNLSPHVSVVNLTITSFPAGAAILLNGTDTGMVTPGTISLDRTGVVVVNLTLAGYREYSVVPNLSPGVLPAVVAHLEPAYLPGTPAPEVPAPPSTLVRQGVSGTGPRQAGSTLHATRVPAIRKDESVVDSFVGFFSSILTRPDCPASMRACGKRCVDLQSDSADCGLCGSACPAGAVCSSGECIIFGPG